MKAEIRALLNDFKAAARIGRRESLESAFTRLRVLPEVASNRPIPEAFLSQALLPLAESLASSGIDWAVLRPFLKDRLTAVRVVAAAALGLRFHTNGDSLSQELYAAGRDPRAEVRTALAQALGEAGKGQPVLLLGLVTPWLQDPSPRLRHTALLALAARAEEKGFVIAFKDKLLEIFEVSHLDEDPEVRAGLAALLIAAARHGLAEAVLDRLKAWAQEPEPVSWVISQVLSASWAAEHLAGAEEVLNILEAQTGLTRYITNARRALQRHIDRADRD